MTNIIAIVSACSSFKLSIYDDTKKEMGYIYLVIIENNPGKHFGLLENLFIYPEYRGHGVGTELLNVGIDRARQEGCYKLVCTSRYDNELAHHIYLKAGFVDWGKEFRLDF